MDGDIHNDKHQCTTLFGLYQKLIRNNSKIC